MKKFNLEEALEGKSVQTKDGRKVTGFLIVNDFPTTPSEALDLEYKGDSSYKQGLRGTIHNTNGYSEYLFYHDGKANMYGAGSQADLFMVSDTQMVDDTTPRELILLRAAYQLLLKQENSSYVINLSSETTVWDGVGCDGSCLMGEAKDLLEALGIDPDYTDELLEE